MISISVLWGAPTPNQAPASYPSRNSAANFGSRSVRFDVVIASARGLPVLTSSAVQPPFMSYSPTYLASHRRKITPPPDSGCGRKTKEDFST
jgi:hypothetical protein